MAGPRRAARGGAVVTGMGVVCAIASDLGSFAAALREGRSGIAPSRDAGERGPRACAAIRGFDFAAAVAGRGELPERLRLAARRAACRSPFPVQVAVVTALQAWENAGLHEVAPPPARLGLVVAGHNLSGRYAQDLYPRFRDDPARLPARFALHYQDTDHVGTLSQALGIAGEGYSVGGASASGNVGIINASRLVELGAVDACLVVGALCDPSPMELRGFLDLGAMAASGGDSSAVPCRPFDEARAGFVPGQGAACLVLESARSARRRGARILAVLRGYALKLDGNSLADPREEGEARVMADAIRRAGLQPRHIDYVNAHGTASRLGDETEVRALRRAFGAAFAGPWINSTKGLTGHCLGAAGVVEAVATVIQMRAGFVHPNLGLARPIDTGCRFVGARAEPATIDFALSNGFGFGGFNTSVVLANRGA